MICLHCGEREYVELLEAWETGEFMLATCCEAVHEVVVDDMNRDPEYRIQLLRELGAEAVFENTLRRVADCDGQFLLDFKLDIRDIGLAAARAFVDKHHAHNEPPVGWRYGAAIYNARQLIGVAMVGRPVARMIDATTTVEVNRLCVRRDIASELAWNACSQLYGWAARQAKRRGFKKIITYTLESEDGTALKAAGWIPEALTKGGSWNCPSRYRQDTAPTCRKTRWARYLVHQQPRTQGVIQHGQAAASPHFA